MINTDILSLIPNPDMLPVAAGWFTVLSYLTYYLHLLSTGIVVGLAVTSVITVVKGRKDPLWQAINQRIAKIIPFTIAIAINLGVAPLLFLQVLYGNFFYTASIVMALPWIGLIPILITGYYIAYYQVFKKEAGKKRGVLPALILSLIVTWTAFILVNINTLMTKPGSWRAYFSSPSGMNLNLTEPSLLPRFILYIFLFLTIGSAFLAIVYKIRNKGTEAPKATLFSQNNSFAFALLSIPAFVYFVVSLPNSIATVFSGGNLGWTLLAAVFILGMAGNGWLFKKGKVIPAAAGLALNLILFVFIRNHIRYLYLQPFKAKFSQTSPITQYPVMILFFVILAAGLALIAWILIKTSKEYKKALPD